MSYAYRIMADIRIAYAAFVRNTGREPNAIYLGKNEVSWLEGMPGLMRGADEGAPNMVAGMPLFTVDVASHLAVGYMVFGKD